MTRVLPQPSTASFFITSHTDGLKTQQSSASMAPTSVGSFVVAKNEDGNIDPNIEETESDLSKFSTCCECSIRTTLVLLISSLVILSIVIVIVTFCASFLPGFLSLSDNKRDSDFQNIVKFSEKTLRELVITNKVTQMQFESSYSVSNVKETELKMFRAFKAEHIFHDQIFVTTYVGDTYGEALCIMKWTDGPAFLNISQTYNEFYYCRDYENTDFCNRSMSIPDEKTAAFDLSYLVQVCNENAGKAVYSESYADPSMPDLTFITLLNCIPKKSNSVKPGSNFEYYYAIDTTTATISTNLKLSTKEIEGSHAYIVESSTGFMIASYDNTPLTTWSADNQLIRLKPSESPNSDIKDVDGYIKERYPKGYSSIEPGTIQTILADHDFIAFQRLKTDYGIDWVFVLAAPRWNYTSSIAIALIASLAGSLVAIVISLIAGVIVSVRLVKPFQNLIDMITSISSIDIDAADLSNTIFSEVKDLQFQFYQMIKRLKLYRSFIPPHLIQEIEKLENETDIEKQQAMIKQVSNQQGLQHKHLSSASLMSSSAHNLSGRKRKSGVAKAALNRFALYLEKRVISVVYMCMDGILDCMDALELSDTVLMLSDIFEQVNQIGKTTSGLVFGFENGCLMIAFNASSNQSGHQEKASNAALTLVSKLDNVRKTKWTQTQSFKSSRQISYLMDGISFRFCIISRESPCGNVGTNDAKIFSIFGNLREELELMNSVSREFGVQILVTEHVYQIVSQFFVMRYIDTKEMTVPFPSRQECDNIHTEECHLYELVENKTVQHDEWMFELEEKKRKEKWKLYNEASGFYLEKKYDQALDLYKIFQSDFPNDKPTQHLIGLCLFHIQEADKHPNK